jgi:aryl-alcohol dehydrogenase-like predicted oxidoreductase
MIRLALGKSDLMVSRLGLGCMGMSEFYGPGDEAESICITSTGSIRKRP